MDKLFFFIFVFAVLLPVSVLFVVLRVGRAIMHQHTKFCWIGQPFIHSFIRGGGWLLAVFQRAFQPTASAEA